MFRGFEIFLKGRDPRDAFLITQRICGVCPNPHAMSSVQAVEEAFGAYPPPAGILIRNVIESAYYSYDHLIHFYLLIGPEVGVLAKRLEMLPPVLGVKGIEDLALGINYAKCVDIQRKATMVVSIWGGKFPHIQNLYPGGVTIRPTSERIDKSIELMTPVWEFIALTHLEDVLKVVEANKRLEEVTEDVLGVRVGLQDIGVSTGNFLSYGIYPDHTDYDDWIYPSLRRKAKVRSGAWKLGDKAPGQTPFDEEKITEDVKYSFFDDKYTGLHPSKGETVPIKDKAGAYSWCKAPRYDDEVYEVGPLARMVNTFGLRWEIPRIHPVTGKDYGPFVWKVRNPKGSLLDRIAARAAFLLWSANLFFEFIRELKDYIGEPVLTHRPVPISGEGKGLWEAPRGALGHWIKIENRKTARYQCIVPGTWNWSPRDDKGRSGAGEVALELSMKPLNATWIPTLSVPEIANALYPKPMPPLKKPWGDTLATVLTALHPLYGELNMEPLTAKERINVTVPLLIVRSFDPCLGCGVHLIKPDGETYSFELDHTH